jgi:hypothetical protein
MRMCRWFGTNRPTRTLSGAKLRAALGAIRYTSALLRQIPLQTLLAALVVSLVAGVLPMILTALCSAACTVLNWCRYAGRPHHHPPLSTSRSDALIRQLELL